MAEDDLKQTASALEQSEGAIYRAMLSAILQNPDRARDLLDQTIERINAFRNMTTMAPAGREPTAQLGASAHQLAATAPRPQSLEERHGRTRASLLTDAAILFTIMRSSRAVSVESLLAALQQKGVAPAGVGALRTRLARMAVRSLILLPPGSKAQDLKITEAGLAYAADLRSRLLRPDELSEVD